MNVGPSLRRVARWPGLWLLLALCACGPELPSASPARREAGADASQEAAPDAGVAARTLCIALPATDAPREAFVAAAEAAAASRGWIVQARTVDRYAFARCDALLLPPSAPGVEAARHAAFPVILTSAAQLDAMGFFALQPTPDVPVGVVPRAVENVPAPGLTRVTFSDALAGRDSELYTTAPQSTRCVRGLQPSTVVATADAACHVGFSFSRDEETPFGPAPGRRVVALLDGEVTHWAAGARALLDWSLREVEREYVAKTSVVATNVKLRADAVLLSALPSVTGIAVLDDVIVVAVERDATNALAALGPGKVIFGREYGGFLRRVVAVSRPRAEAPEYIIETEPAAAPDLIASGTIDIHDEFEGTEPLASDDDGRGQDAGPPDASVADGASSMDDARDGGRPRGNVSAVMVGGSRNLLQAVAGRLRAQCSAAFSGMSVVPTVGTSLTGDLRLEFADGVGIARARVALTGRARALLELEAQPRVSGSCTASYTAPAFRFTTQTTVIVAGIPVPILVQHVIQPSISVNVGGTIEGPGIDARAGVEADVGIEAVYTPDTGWTRQINTPNPQPIAEMTIQRQGTLTLRAGAVATLSYTAALYGILGPRAQLILSTEGSYRAGTDCNYTAQGNANLDLRLDIARPGAEPECRQDPAVMADFNARFGTVREKAEVVREWYLNARCSDKQVVLGRFTEFADVGREENDLYLNVVPDSDWSYDVNWAYLQGAFDRAATLQLATDPRHPRATKKSSARGVLDCNGAETITAQELARVRRAGYTVDYEGTSAPQTMSGSCSCLAGPDDRCRFAFMPLARIRRGWRRLLPEISFSARLASVTARREGRLSIAGCACEPPRMAQGDLCVCPPPLEWNGVGCACPAATPVLDRERNACVACTGDRSWNGTECVCPAPRAWDGTACSCPQDRPFWNERTGVCTPCQTGHRVGGRCVECPETQFFDGTSCVCIPPSRLEGDRCVANCTPPASWDGFACVCPQSQPDCNVRESWPGDDGDPNNCNPGSQQAFLRSCRFRMTRTNSNPECASRPAVEVRETSRTGQWFSAMTANRARYGDVCCQPQDVPFLNLGSFRQDGPADWTQDACGTIELIGCTTTLIPSPGCN